MCGCGARVLACSLHQEMVRREVDMPLAFIAEQVGPSCSSVVLRLDRPHLLRAHDVDEPGFLQRTNVVADCAFGFVQSVREFLDGRSALQQEVDDANAGLFEQSPVLPRVVQSQRVGKLVVGRFMVGHSRMVGDSRPFVKLESSPSSGYHQRPISPENTAFIERLPSTWERSGTMPDIGEAPSQTVPDGIQKLISLEGFAQRVLSAKELPAVWTQFRVRAAGATLLTTLVLGILWSWPGGYVISGVAAVALIDALVRQRNGFISLPITVALDMTLVGVGITIADLDPAGIGAPFAYMMAVPLLLLSSKKAVGVMLLGITLTVGAILLPSPFPLPAWVNAGVVDAIAYTIFTSLLIGLIAVVARSLHQSRQFTDRKLREEAALAAAGEELLANASDETLVEAIEAIREATGATAAFVAENAGDRTSGPAAVIRQVTAGEAGPITWTLPYMQHRDAAAELAHGRPVRLDEPLGMIIGGGPGSAAAVAVPTSVGGEWAGFLGIAYTSLPAPEPDIRVLETFAAMIGAFMERRQAYRRLEQAVQSKDQFLASVSHEIKTPLTSVVGLAAVLGDDDGQLSEDDQRDLIGLIRTESQEVADLVEDLLVAGRAEIDQVKVAHESVHLAEEIEIVLKSRLGVDDKDVFVASSLNHVAIADASRVRQILRNLLTNALRYGGKEITITTHRDGPETTLVFSDNGDGIPPEYRKRIFDPYHRGQKGLSRSDSVGLGLAVSRQLARLMDGDLTLRSDLGPATFQLSLPTAPRQPDDDVKSPEVVLVGE